MARPRKHNDNATRQAAYRQRQLLAKRKQLEAKGLLPLPAIPTVPGWRRWNQAIGYAESLVTIVQTEMEQYYDDRSEAWLQSERAEEFQQKLQELGQILDSASNWLI